MRSTASAIPSVSGFENQRNRRAQTLPAGGFCVELLASDFGEAVVFGLASAFGGFPVGFEPAPVFQPVECGIEGALANLQRLMGDLVDALDNGVSMDREERGDLQDKHVERSLEQFSVGGRNVGLPRHSRYQDRGWMPRMSRHLLYVGARHRSCR